MTEKVLPKYPVYVPSKGRVSPGLTPKFLIRDEVPFYLVVEEEEADAYRQAFGHGCEVLVLPESGGGLIYARNWIKDHSIREVGAERHWQLDDNICQVRRWYRGQRLPCRSGVALRATEDFVDRYENVAVAGLNYTMFAADPKAPPFNLNVHVYSCSLILNSIPHRWRLRHNDDTDLCLQVLSDGWCTILMNAFLVDKVRTMVVKGGNTDDLYQGDGRLVMARSLERVWPGVVETRRRFKRPQHVVRDNWKKFDNQLRRKPDVVLEEGTNEYGMRLRPTGEEVSPGLRHLVEDDGSDI